MVLALREGVCVIASLMIIMPGSYFQYFYTLAAINRDNQTIIVKHVLDH